MVAKNKAAKTAKNAEFIVTPGQLFSSYVFNAKEVQSSLSKRGAYMKIAGNKFFAANQAFRSTLAATLYGRGYGEIGYWKSAASSAPTMTANTPYTLDGLTLDLTAKIDIDSSIVLKKATDEAELVELVVTDEDNSSIVVVEPLVVNDIPEDENLINPCANQASPVLKLMQIFGLNVADSPYGSSGLKF